MTRRPELKSEGSAGRLVGVQSKFAVESVKQGGVSRAEAAQQAETVIESSRAELDERLRASIAALAEMVSDLEFKPSVDSDLIHEFRDHARRVRDFGSLAGFEAVTMIAAMLCDVLNGVVDGRLRFRAEVVRCFVDPLELLCCAEQGEAGTPQASELLAELEVMQRKLLPDFD